MKRKLIISALAGAAIAVSGPALAKPGGGNGGGHGAGNAGATVGGTVGSTMGGGRGAGVSGGTDISVGSSISTRGPSMSTDATTRGNAGTRGSIDTSTDIGMRSSTQTSRSMQLSGITSGMNVVDSSGTTIGTVSGVTTRGNGSARTVQVTLTDGTVIDLNSRSLSLNGDVLTTSSTTSTANASNRRVNSQGPAHANVNGLTHANENSVLSTAGVTTLTGLAAGATVSNANGTLGTVNSIVTNKSGAVVGINVTLDSGGTVFIPATTLTMNGTAVTTTYVPHG